VNDFGGGVVLGCSDGLHACIVDPPVLLFILNRNLCGPSLVLGYHWLLGIKFKSYNLDSSTKYNGTAI